MAEATSNVLDIFEGRIVTWDLNGVEWMGVYKGDEDYTTVAFGVQKVIAKVTHARPRSSTASFKTGASDLVRVLRDQLTLMPPLTGTHLLADVGMRARLKMEFRGEVKAQVLGDYNLFYMLYFPNGKGMWVGEKDVSLCPEWEAPDDTKEYDHDSCGDGYYTAGWDEEHKVNMIYYP